MSNRGRNDLAHLGADFSEDIMKKIALCLDLVVASLSLGGCYVGEGKSPAPVVTRG
jgi:hypothetical protein